MRTIKRVAVYGAAGLVGCALCEALTASGLEPVAFDQNAGPKVHHADLLTTDLRAQLTEHTVDAVAHLVARVDPPTKRGRAAMRELHEVGTRRLVVAARESGVARFVLCSSAVVYGARADNPIPLTEAQPVAPNANFPYAVDKAMQERICVEEARNMALAIARPAIIYSREAKNYLTEFLRRVPFVLPAVDGRRPPLQFVHVTDVAAALCALLQTEHRGAFNIGPEPITYEEVAAITHKRVVHVPRRLIAKLVTVGAELVPAHLRAPDYVLDQLAFPYVVSAKKLRQELGVTASVTSAQALAEMFSG